MEGEVIVDSIDTKMSFCFAIFRIIYEVNNKYGKQFQYIGIFDKRGIIIIINNINI